MKDIQKNIEQLMKNQNIKSQTDLLKLIAHRLNKNPYKFIEAQKANFSKMLKGTRTMNDEFIIPLEEILHTTYAEIVNGNIYSIPDDKKFIPYLKGIRYYAYLDKPELYKELLKEVTDEGKPVIANFDEYNFTFADYVIKYKSINGMKFLIEEFGFCYHSDLLYFVLKSTDDLTLYHRLNEINLAIGIVNFDNPYIFNKIFDPFSSISSFLNKAPASVYLKDEYIEALLKNDHVLKSLYISKRINIKAINKGRLIDNSQESGLFINPLLTPILDFALRNLNEFKKEVIEILNFGIKTNKEIISSLEGGWQVSDNGIIERYKDYAISAAVLISKYQTVDDKEINSLIKKLNEGLNHGK